MIYFTGFLIASLALLTSYTRAAWLGAAAGILLILILKKKWFILLPGVLLLAGILILSKSESKVKVYNYKLGSLHEKYTINTEGRASDIYVDSTKLLVADYEQGLLIFKNKKLMAQLKTAAPIIRIDKWIHNFYLALLIDKRMLLLKQTGNYNLKINREFTSPGNTASFCISNEYLYVSDYDSGLTIYIDPQNLKENIRFPMMRDMKYFGINSKYLAAYLQDSSLFNIYYVNNKMPGRMVYSQSIKSSRSVIWLDNNKIFFGVDNKLSMFEASENSIREVDSNKELINLVKYRNIDDQMFLTSVSGIVFDVKGDETGLIIQNKMDLGFSPTDVEVVNNDFYISFNRRNRLSTIYDPYHITNIQRANQWKTGLKILSSYPLFGVGDIDLQLLYSKFRNYYEKENFGHLHNNYVHIIVILGIFGFCAVLYLLTKIYLLHIRIYKELKHEEFASSFSLGTLALFTSFLVSGLAEWNFGDHEIITMIWFTLGLNLAFYKFYTRRA